MAVSPEAALSSAHDDPALYASKAKIEILFYI
jgi:hypothetical protein